MAHPFGRRTDALAYLRVTGLALDIEKVPHGAGWRLVARRVSSDLGRAVAPPLPFRRPAGWQHVEILSDLFHLGQQLQKNCVASISNGSMHHLV